MNSNSQSDVASMARRIAAFNWASTPLGPSESWSGDLAFSVKNCLGNRFPISVWWGPALTMIYNDAYVPLLGKRHSAALGSSAKEVWADVWPILGPQVEQVLRTGQATWSEEVLVVVERNGFPENGWFTWSFSPLEDESGRISGVQLTVVEVTQRVLAERERVRRDEAAKARQAEERARTILESISDAFFALSRDWEFSYANSEAGRILGRPTSELIGKSIWEEYPGLHGTDFEPIYRRAMDERVPGQITQFYPDHDRWYEVRTYPSPDGISVFFRDVSEGKRAEVVAKEIGEQLERHSRLFDRIASTTPDFIYTFDLAGHFLYANKRLLDVFGVSLDQAVGKSFLELGYPQWHADMHLRELRQVIETKQPIKGEVPFTGGSGISGVYEYIFMPVLSPDGEVEVVIGTTRDVTDRKRFDVEQRNLLAALDAERANLADMIARSPAFMAMLRGPTHVFELANDRYFQIVNRRDIIGKPVREALPEVVSQGFIELLDRVYQTGEPFIGNEVAADLGPEGGADKRYVNFVYQAVRDAAGNVSGIFVHGVDVTDIVRSRGLTEEREARFRQLADAMPQIVWSAKPDGELDYYNRRWLEYIDVADEKSPEARWDKYIHPADLPRAYAAWTESVSTEQTYNIEFRVKRADGKFRWFLVRALPVRDLHQRVIRWHGTCTDIQEQKELESERESLLVSERSARSEAERQGRMKDEFLATLSHELRTPLTAILGWSQIVARPSARPEDIAQGLDVIQRNARAQSQIIEDLLDMSRIISGKVRLDVQRLELSSIVQSAVEAAGPTAEAKGVRLTSVIDPLQGVAVSGDANRIQQVLWNLLTNAVKFTPKGGRIQVLLERVNSHLELIVIDTGEGVEPKFLPFVFDRFSQADGSTTRRHGGLGLGLSIVRQLVELHGGSVRVNSAGKGQGTTFIVALPLTVMHADAQPEAERQHPRIPKTTAVMPDACQELEGIRILVVDDEIDARNLVRRLLVDCKAEVATAGSAGEAFLAMTTKKFDVLVSDIGMPGEDGYSLIKRIRALGKNNGGDVPAIALTAYARAEDRTKAIVAGFQMHISKPVEPAELVAMVASAAELTVRFKS